MFVSFFQRNNAEKLNEKKKILMMDLKFLAKILKNKYEMLPGTG